MRVPGRGPRGARRRGCAGAAGPIWTEPTARAAGASSGAAPRGVEDGGLEDGRAAVQVDDPQDEGAVADEPLGPPRRRVRRRPHHGRLGQGRGHRAGLVDEQTGLLERLLEDQARGDMAQLEPPDPILQTICTNDV